MHTPHRESTTKTPGTIAPLLVSLLQRDTIKTLSFTDPWGELVALDVKHLETRSWPTDYRGPLAIHVSSRFPVEAEDLCSVEPFYTALSQGGFQQHLRQRQRRNAWQFPLGCIVAVAWLEDVRRLSPVLLHEQLPAEPELSFGNYLPGRFVWELSMVYRLPQPIPATGALGLWEWHPSISFWEEAQARLDSERQKGAHA